MNGWDCYAHIGAHRGIDVQGLRQEMDRCAVQRAVLMPFLDAPGFDDLLSAARQQPDRFVAVCRLDAGRVASADGRRQFAALLNGGFAGARLLLPPPDQPDGDLDAALSSLGQASGTLVVHAPDGIGRHAARLLAWADRHPGLRIFVPHLGWPRAAEGADSPDWADGIRRLGRHERLYAGLSALYYYSRRPPPFEDTRALVRQVLAAFTPARCVLGGDYPMTLNRCTYAQVWEALDQAVGDPEQARQMAVETPRQLWRATE